MNITVISVTARDSAPFLHFPAGYSGLRFSGDFSAALRFVPNGLGCEDGLPGLDREVGRRLRPEEKCGRGRIRMRIPECRRSVAGLMCAGKPNPANAPPRRGIRAAEKTESAHRAVDDELHLAEEVGAERTVGVAQEQFPRRADSFDRGGEEAAVRQAVRMRRLQPVHAGAVVALQRVGIAPFEQCVPGRAVRAEPFEHLLPVERAAGGWRPPSTRGWAARGRTRAD